MDTYDYSTFLFYLKLYLTPPKLLQKTDKVQPMQNKIIRLDIKNVSLHEQIKLLTYCLMPNHFHLLIKQVTHDGITKFMRRLCTAYSMVFNQRYKRTGGLFEGNYKAALIETEEQLLHVSRYIHQNPKDLAEVGPIQFINYPYSSLPQYLGKYKTAWLHPKEILSFFSQKNLILDYKNFVLEEETKEEYLLLSGLKVDEEI